MTLRPLHDRIFFTFTDSVTKSGFTEVTDSGIIVAGKFDSAVKNSRTGKVIAVGAEVESVQVGDIIAIESMMWSNAFTVTDGGEKFWMTDESKVLAILSES